MCDSTAHKIVAFIIEMGPTNLPVKPISDFLKIYFMRDKSEDYIYIIEKSQSRVGTKSQTLSLGCPRRTKSLICISNFNNFCSQVKNFLFYFFESVLIPPSPSKPAAICGTSLYVKIIFFIQQQALTGREGYQDGVRKFRKFFLTFLDLGTKVLIRLEVSNQRFCSPKTPYLSY